MIERPTAVERAFELARSARCLTTTDIRKKLKEEGHSLEAIAGPALLKQLTAILQAKRRDS
jgi:hypothetical protein